MCAKDQTDDELPDCWELGPLIAVRPETILTPGTTDKLEEFVLALALIFNDLKTAVLLQETLPKNPANEEICPAVGQRGGIGFHLSRLAASIIHELLNLIAGSQEVVNDPRFADLLRRVPTTCAQMWHALMRDASDATPASRVLCMIRNNATFHYNQPKALAEGFRAFFFKDAKVPRNQAAYVSVGPNMEATRFYYADAAAQRGMSILGAKKGIEDIHPMVMDYVRKTNFALAAVVREYIHSRDPACGVSPLRSGRG